MTAFRYRALDTAGKESAGVLEADTGRAARNLNVSSFRLLLALLILSVGLRFAVELFLPPNEPYSVVVPEGAQR